MKKTTLTIGLSCIVFLSSVLATNENNDTNSQLTGLPSNAGIIVSSKHIKDSLYFISVKNINSGNIEKFIAEFKIYKNHINGLYYSTERSNW